MWLPVHKSAIAIGEAKLSNDNRLSCSDWRANRLVDMLAKAAAAAHLSCGRDVAEAAFAHAACCLGVVTHAANTHQVVALGEGGAEITSIQRDSIDKPRLLKSTSAPDLATPKLIGSAKDVGTVTAMAWVAPSPKIEANKQLRAVSCEALRSCVQEIGRLFLSAKASSLAMSLEP